MAKKIKLLKLADGILEQYRKSVRNNENITEELARKKFTRNSMLGEIGYDPYMENGGTLIKYGYTHFLIKNRTVVWFRSHCKYPRGWVKDESRYNELNKLLGIAE